MHWVCTRHGKQTTTYSHFISINTRIIEVVTSSSRSNHSHRPRYSSSTSRSSGGSNSLTSNDKHDTSDSVGNVLSKPKCKTLFSRNFARILIVILVSFTFADMVHGKCISKHRFYLLCAFLSLFFFFLSLSCSLFIFNSSYLQMTSRRRYLRC